MTANITITVFGTGSEIYLQCVAILIHLNTELHMSENSIKHYDPVNLYQALTRINILLCFRDDNQ